MPKITACIALFSLSIFLSFKGAGVAIQYFTAPPALIQLDTVKQPYLDQLATIETTKAMAAKMTWKGRITRKGQAIIKEATNQESAINAAMFQAVSIAETRNDVTNQNHQDNTASKAIYGAYLQLFLEFMLFCCLWYGEYYDWRSMGEFAKPRTARFMDTKEPAPPLIVTGKQHKL